MIIKGKHLGIFCAFLLSLSSGAIAAAGDKTPITFPDLKHGNVVLQIGGLKASQGKAQHISIKGLVGNYYTINDKTEGKGLIGAGYYLHGFDQNRYQLAYGVNVFYLASASTNGNILQENLFKNLSYQYDVRHIPLYFDAKGIINTNNDKYNITVDVGLGPNFMRTSNYREMPLNNFTLPDNAFSPHNQVTLSTTAGAGFRANNVFGKIPVECGYRFFYLGKGRLTTNNNQLVNSLHTGNAYANAVLCSITV